jgi:S-phase kinase-associated protein 1
MNKEALDRSRTDNLTEYDRNFIESLDTPTHLRVLLAANFLNIPPLLVIAQKHLANLIKSRQPEEIKTFFKIPDELQDDDRNP